MTPTTFDELETLINEAVESLLSEAKPVTAADMGLDPRSFYGTAWIVADERLFVVPKGLGGSLDYYGGFEYVDKDAVRRMGSFTVYDGNLDSRVDEHISIALGEEPPDEEDE